ncbi:MAG: lipid A biosynthesis lauroyl acyltransferase [Pseudolabrys sp.]|nr:lipid A biosynthesis lauroyl acyltransferase [Pseudolabrys sp.]MBV9953897.1 lipid A biosynthesis lauroyl acyltransferase [Pseudolabrys sp.]
MPLPRSIRIFGARLRKIGDAVAGAAAAGALRLLRLIDRRKLSYVAAATLRRIGPWLPEHRIGRANLHAAFPEKSAAEIEKILDGAWDNLGRFVADFAHLDRLTLTDESGVGDVDYSPATIAAFQALKAEGRPRLLFAAHLANWELPALVPARFGQASAVLYRRPNVAAAAEAALRIRGATMGQLIASGFDAPLKIVEALRAGKWVGMLVDQYMHNGVPVIFFGRRTRANPTIARIARQMECPIHGVRARRLADGRYQIEISEPIAPARDAEGKIDVDATMQVIMSMIEGWIRETPEQWLWQHRRWRERDASL